MTMTRYYSRCCELQRKKDLILSVEPYLQEHKLIFYNSIHGHEWSCMEKKRNVLLDVLLEVEWMACELLCEAATVAKLPALVVAM